MIGLNPRMSARLRSTMYEDLLPDWTTQAACAGRDTSDWFRDEVADAPTPKFPEPVYRAMKVCFGCPVRQQCLEWAYEAEQSEDKHWWAGTLIEQRRRFGVYGGVPGRIRERYAEHPRRLEALDAWLNVVAEQRRWRTPEEVRWQTSSVS